MRWVPAIVSLHFFPGWNAFHLGRILPNFSQDTTVHVLTNRQAEQGKKSRGDIKKIGTKDRGVLLETGTFRYKNPQVTVLNCGTVRLVRNFPGPKMIRVESVIRHHDDRRVIARKLEGDSQHDVVESINPLNDVFVELEVLFPNMVPPWRVILHEAMAKMIYGIIINAHEIPFFILHHGGGAGMNTRAFGQKLGSFPTP